MPVHGRRGFTLVELLVVIAIIGILSTAAIAAMGEARRKSRDLKRVADVRQMVISLELFNNDANGYPPAQTPVALGSSNYKSLCYSGFKAACGTGEKYYQALIPSAPQPVDGNCSQTQNDYSYQAANKGEFKITFCLGKGVNDLVAGVHSATPSGIK
jgi:prepilin-type N-terminal cleavage/methylation domain-containing protein